MNFFPNIFTLGLSLTGVSFFGDEVKLCLIFSLSGLSSARCLANFFFSAWAMSAAGSLDTHGLGAWRIGVPPGDLRTNEEQY